MSPFVSVSPLIEYRPFLNTDPPFLAEIWRAHPPLRGLAQAVSPVTLERHVFSKPYFDRHGLIVAVQDGHPIGFVHAGFGTDDAHKTLSTQIGVTCLIMVAPHEQREEILMELLKRSENYLAQAGAKTLYAGGAFPHNPFYLGLYGGSRLPGILAEDHLSEQLFRKAGYEEIRRSQIFHRKLTGFRPAVNRMQLQARRRYQVISHIDPISTTWWEACTLGHTDRIRFDLHDRQNNDVCGSVVFWDMEPLSSSWGVHAMGLYDLSVDETLRRQGLATFLLGEALRQLQEHGTTLAEVQLRVANTAAIGLFEKLDFETVDEGIILQKVLNGPADEAQDEQAH